MTATAPLSHADRDADVEAAPAKPLGRSRSPTQSPDERSRKRHRPDSPSLQSHQQISTAESTSSTADVGSPAASDRDEQSQDDFKSQSSKQSRDDVTPKPEPEPANGEGDTAETDQEEGELPPLPPGPPPEEPPSDGWEAIWEPEVGQYYFYNHLSGETTWTNPRVPPSEDAAAAPADQSGSTADSGDTKQQYSGYVPAIHGDYDPTAPYAQQPERTPSPTIDPYVAHAAFNRFTGRFQNGPGTDQQTEESRQRRQMEIYFDVDAAANCHDGRSLKAERQAKKLTKKEVKAFREKTRLKKEEKKRAWLRD
ncbi:hypothetical protein Dda_4266 [Drechslerella dactyloides]|uniref:WW domain-containing protein n=1 Tax=Drechslerella dactyloides TaxID=74499 RepID=A0AAD6NJ98_DREDA|nr:hypothetical protein Dda_4266 [Drechslerella dactyloides]